jgi:hypothetical protein
MVLSDRALRVACIETEAPFPFSLGLNPSNYLSPIVNQGGHASKAKADNSFKVDLMHPG